MSETFRVQDGFTIDLFEQSWLDKPVMVSLSAEGDDDDGPVQTTTIVSYLSPSDARRASAFLLAMSARAEGGGGKVRPSLDEVLQRLVRARGQVTLTFAETDDGAMRVSDLTSITDAGATGTGSTILAAVEELVTWRLLDIASRRGELEREATALTDIADALDVGTTGTGVMDGDDVGEEMSDGS